MKYLHCLLFALGLLLGGVSLSAQNPAPTLNTDIRLFRSGEANWEGIYYQAKPNDYQLLEFGRYAISEPVPYRGPNPLYLYRQELSPEGNLTYRPVAAANLLPGTRLQTLYCFPATDPAETREFHIITSNEDEQALPADHIIFINATGAELLGQLDAYELRLAPGVSGAYDVSSFFGREVPVGLVVKNGQTYEKVLMNRVIFSPDRRMRILLLPPSDPGSLRIRALRLSEPANPVTPANETTPRRTAPANLPF